MATTIVPLSGGQPVQAKDAKRAQLENPSWLQKALDTIYSIAIYPFVNPFKILDFFASKQFSFFAYSTQQSINEQPQSPAISISPTGPVSPRESHSVPVVPSASVEQPNPNVNIVSDSPFPVASVAASPTGPVSRGTFGLEIQSPPRESHSVPVVPSASVEQSNPNVNIVPTLPVASVAAQLVAKVNEKRNQGVLFKNSESSRMTVSSQSKKQSWMDKTIDSICCRQKMEDSSPVLVPPQRQVLQIAPKKDSLQKKTRFHIVITSPRGHSRTYSPDCKAQQGKDLGQRRPCKSLDIPFR